MCAFGCLEQTQMIDKSKSDTTRSDIVSFKIVSTTCFGLS